ncbi:MAG: hypothetical protein LT071_10290, partial [Nocardioides sp.]|nr:hypothetical protein [Nocardioides sp.]
IDPQGRVVASAGAREAAVMVEEIGLVDTPSPASVMGQWPANVILAGAVLHLLTTGLTYHRRRLRAGARPSTDLEGTTA